MVTVGAGAGPAIPDFLAVPLVVAGVLTFLLVVRLPPLAPLEHALERRWVPIILGAATASAMWFSWGTLRHVPLLQDEAAYLLQAHLFAAGRWADPAPPIPSFFEQPHVLVTPTLAAKYPPGNALLLTPGIWLHLPGLVPVLLLGVTGALIFVLVRRVGGRRLGPWPGLLALLGWLGLIGHEAWPRPSYMSEIATSALWLLGWWALLRWRERRRLGYLLLLAGCVSWGAITRPLTMLAYAVPLAPIVLVLVARRRQWGQLVIAGALGVTVLGLIPLWSARTTGNWRLTPVILYTAQYIPWDGPGFGFLDTPALRPLPAEMGCFPGMFGELHRQYTPAALPGILVARAQGLVSDTFAGWRQGLLPFVLIALAFMPVEVGVAVTTCIALMIAYLWFPHAANYTIYYMETQPTAAVVAALGVCEVARAVGARWGRRFAGELPTDAGRRVSGWCAIILLLLAIRPTRDAVEAVRHGHEIGDLPHRMFRSAVDSLPSAQSVVFVHYPPGEGCGQNLIENEPPLTTARAWIVYDRGIEDEQLLRLAPGRAAYMFDTKSGQLRPYGPRTGVDTSAVPIGARDRVARPG